MLFGFLFLMDFILLMLLVIVVLMITEMLLLMIEVVVLFSMRLDAKQIQSRFGTVC